MIPEPRHPLDPPPDIVGPEPEPDPSAAAGPLRDELLAMEIDSYPLFTQYQIDQIMPVVRRYADAQVAAERGRCERICHEAIEATMTRAGVNAVKYVADRIARGQP